jgi:hypothetical protein
MSFKQNTYKLVFLIFLFGFIIRIISVIPANTIIGFDQARDLFQATTIFRDHKLHIIGPTAGNNPNLHHGVLFWYYLIPGLVLFRGNPIGAVIENSFFNALSIIVMYFLGRDLFKSKRIGIIAAAITAVSYYYIQFSGWLSNPTGTFFTLPLFFLGLVEYKNGKKWGSPLSLFFLGLTIQFELFFLYLIPVLFIAFIILRPKFPSIKLMILSVFAFMIATSSMILTEIKFHFAGIRSILFAGQFVGGEKPNFWGILITFLREKWETFYLNFWPQNKNLGTLIGILAVSFLIFEIIKNKQRQRNLFLLLWFFSPAIMFLLGQHNAPWFYIGRPAAAILIGAYLISKIKSKTIVVFILMAVIIANITAIRDSMGSGQALLEPDKSSFMSDQLTAIDYTYKNSNGQQFEINTLTNPLYVNAVWGYQYYWYGLQKYNYLPSFVGGDQLYPYNTLPKSTGQEKFLYLLMDMTDRISPQYRNEIIKSADKLGHLVEEKQFGGIDVQKRILK